ncbi:carboxylating.nicotinate-nucleotide diphosphorylase, partial [Candidatus Bathyarchaeota archaeon]
MFIPRKILEKKLLNLLIDDIGQGDLTSSLLLPESLNAKAEIQVKQDGVVAGIEEAIILVESLGLKLLTNILDGSDVSKTQIIMSFSGDAKTILSIERTILNILSRMSGITTITNQIIKKLRASKLDTKLAATRKTVPGLNYFDKKAVFIGGGDTHRMNLADMILIKNNHITLAGDIQKAIRIAK